MNLILRLFSIIMIFSWILVNLYGALIGIYFFPIHIYTALTMIIIGSSISIFGIHLWKKYHKKIK